MNGNFENFRDLVRMTSKIVYPVIARMTGNEDRAMDILQETMITVWQKINTIKSPDIYKPWVYRIAVNKCYDHLRWMKRNPEQVASDEIWQSLSSRLTDGSYDEIDNKEIFEIIGRLTAALSPKQKTVFILSELEGMTPDEISGITGFGKTAIKANLHYARKSIAEKLEKFLQ